MMGFNISEAIALDKSEPLPRDLAAVAVQLFKPANSIVITPSNRDYGLPEFRGFFATFNLILAEEAFDQFFF